MAIREELVASAVNFLQDPNVASSPVESKIAFLQAKNLTQEEVNVALARAGGDHAAASQQYALGPRNYAGAPPPQPYYGQPSPYAWQAAPPAPPKRDWRDWFIMATVAGGVSYGLFSLTKRYIYPLVAPPTPERLEQDKKSIDDQFEKAFALVDQLAKDTEALKAAEQQRTERLDTAISELETVMNDLKMANRRREDDAQRLRDDVQDLKDSLPKAIEADKEQVEQRLKDVNSELKSLKTLISQRLNPTTTPPSMGPGYLRAATSNAPPSPLPSATPTAVNGNTADSENKEPAANGSRFGMSSMAGGSMPGRASPFSSGMPSSAKVSIPEWQRSMTKQGQTSSAAAAGISADSSSSASKEDGGAPKDGAPSS